MLRLYRVLGDNRIPICAFARAIDVQPKRLRRWLREQRRIRFLERLRVEAALARAGIRENHLWESEPEFVHPFFEHEALTLGNKPSDGIEPLEAFEEQENRRAGDRRFGGASSASTDRLSTLTCSAPTSRGKEVPMAQKVSDEVLKKFRLTSDPFVNELHAAEDVFMSKVHRRAEWLLLDAAAHQYFVALVGAVGSGKTVVLKRVLEKLDPKRNPDYRVSRLRCVEKEYVNAYSIMEALVRDFSSEAPKHSREARARQIGAMLESMIREKRKPVLVIDEAHALNTGTLRALKRLYDETECGFRRSIAILLVGQNSNADKSYNLEDKLGNWDLREVSERCQLLRLAGLDGELGAYLEWKFRKAGARREILEPQAVRLLQRDYDTPLVVNNIVSLAMNLAFEVGKDVVTAELMSDAIKAAQAPA